MIITMSALEKRGFKIAPSIHKPVISNLLILLKTNKLNDFLEKIRPKIKYQKKKIKYKSLMYTKLRLKSKTILNDISKKCKNKRRLTLKNKPTVQSLKKKNNFDSAIQA